MIDSSLLTAKDFIGVRASLIATLGNDANRAVVLTRIYWRTLVENRDTHERDGQMWWRATYQTLADHTGLTVNQVKRIVPWLVEKGYVETREFRLDGITDRTLSMRVITSMADSHSRSAIPHLDMADSHSQGSADSHSLPSTKKEDSSSEIGNLRPDVEELLDLLDENIKANGSRVPKRNKANRDAMRLLIDRDGRSPEEIARVIRWCQTDSFWRANILSASKLREKYDHLRLRTPAQKHEPKQTRNPFDVEPAGWQVAAREAGML